MPHRTAREVLEMKTRQILVGLEINTKQYQLQQLARDRCLSTPIPPPASPRRRPAPRGRRRI